MNKPAVAIVRGAFLNRYEMQSFEPLIHQFDLTAFGSLSPIHDRFAFPVVKLVSPMDLPSFPYKMPILNRLFTDAHYLWGLEEKLTGFDLVHTAETYYRYTQQALNAKKQGRVKKVIATVWETIPFHNEGIRGRKAYKRRSIRELDHMIAVTDKAKEALIAEGADPQKISVIGASLDTGRFSPAKDWLKRLGDPNNRSLTILFVGRLEEEKGVTDILEAASLLGRDPALRSYKLTWKFIGDGPLRHTVSAAARGNGPNWHLELQSATYDEMPRVYRQADLFVAPSKFRLRRGKVVWEEQYGMALLEAQAAGLPIVTTRSGGIPANVNASAVLMRPGDVQALTREVKDLLLYPRKRITLARRARRRAVTIHDIGIGSHHIADVYQRVLAEDDTMHA